jgi:hypothetical protein
MTRHLSREHEIKTLAIHADSDKIYKLSHAPQFKNAEQFIQAKLKMLVQDFRIHPTEREIEHLYELATEREINCAVRQIINDHWK